jgi:small nuclear ribonucleoprotein D3
MASSVPIEILHEAEGSMVAVEMKKGDIYRGKLASAEDSMNCHLSEVTHKAKDGKISKMEQVYLRGSHVKLFVLPDMLVNAPALAKVAKAVASKAEADAAKRGLGAKARGAASAGASGGRNVFN